MKNISIRISADDEPIGAFTLDPTTTAYVLAIAKEKSGQKISGRSEAIDCAWRKGAARKECSDVDDLGDGN